MFHTVNLIRCRHDVASYGLSRHKKVEYTLYKIYFVNLIIIILIKFKTTIKHLL